MKRQLFALLNAHDELDIPNDIVECSDENLVDK
jgi:hypothetical protein